MHEPLVEIRVPTYKRADWLTRALQSVVAQTWTHWVCLVFDDSPEQEAAAVVTQLKDDRFQHRPNRKRQGGCGNIDQCFAEQPYAGGAFACLLEDDNWFLPDFLQANLDTLEAHGVDLLLRNQQVWQQKSDRSFHTSRTTRGRVFEEGILTPEDLHACLLVFEGISNGGLFWRLDRGLRLQVGEGIPNTCLQECLRTCCIDRPVWFAAEPLAVWSHMHPSLKTRRIPSAREYSVGREEIVRRVLAKYGLSVLERAQRFTSTPGLQDAYRLSLARVGLRAPGMNRLRFLREYAAALTNRWRCENPVRVWFQERIESEVLPKDTSSLQQ